MKIVVLENELRIQPETTQDRVYLEQFAQSRKDTGIACEVVTCDGGELAYLEVR